MTLRKATPLLLAGIVMAVAAPLCIGSGVGDSYAETLVHDLRAANISVCRDENYNVEMPVPNIFVTEADTAGAAFSYARYAYYPKASQTDAFGHIYLEYCAQVCRDSDAWTERTDSTTQPSGYSIYAKSVRAQKMKFTYSLTYPSAYEASVLSLKSQVAQWHAFAQDRAQIRPTYTRRHKRAKTFHSGFATE